MLHCLRWNRKVGLDLDRHPSMVAMYIGTRRPRNMKMISSSIVFIHSCSIPFGGKAPFFMIYCPTSGGFGLGPSVTLVLDGTLRGPIIPICNGDCGDHVRPTTIFVTPTRTEWKDENSPSQRQPDHLSTLCIGRTHEIVVL